MSSGPILRNVLARRIALALVLALLPLCAVIAQAASTPAPFPVVDGTIHSAVVAGNTLFIGGEFGTVTNPGADTGIPRLNLAAIDLETGALRNEWIADVMKNDAGDQAAVYALAVSAAGGALFVGGDFDTIRSAGRDNLAAVSTNTGVPVTAWAQSPGPDAPVRVLARSQDGINLYVGGDFSAIGVDQRLRLASVNPGNGALLPWDPGLDGAVHALALDGAQGRLFAGGEFGLIGDVSCPGFAAISLSSARATACDPSFAGDAVHALAHAEGALVIGGSFTTVAGQARNHLALLEASGDGFVLDEWHPDISDAVHALALDTANLRLYAGGEFMSVAGDTPRARLASFRLDPLDENDRLLAWNPGANATVRVLALGVGGERLYVGGEFTEIGAADLDGLAALPIATPVTIADPPGGGHQLLGFVTLDCEDRSGAGCARICYSTGEDPPADACIPMPPDSIEVVLDNEVTTLRFFSEDTDGNREAERTERYAIDDEPPVTEVSLPPLPDDAWYGAATLEPIVMACLDNHVEFGCATHYTLDGSEPTTASTRYTAPVSLGSLLPPPSIPPDEVDPLQHLSGTFTLRVFSIDDAGNREDTQDIVYRVDLAAPVVTPSLPSGTFIAPATLSLECDDGAGSGCDSMYYTTDNRTPSDGTVRDVAGDLIPATARYEGPLTLTDATILRVLAIDRAGNASSQIIGVYALSEQTRETRSGVGVADWALLLALLSLLSRRMKGVRPHAGSDPY
jgi:hypothetical protein